MHPAVPVCTDGPHHIVASARGGMHANAKCAVEYMYSANLDSTWSVAFKLARLTCGHDSTIGQAVFGRHKLDFHPRAVRARVPRARYFPKDIAI